MSSPSGKDRRDPYSPVLRLGSVLSTARHTRNSGHIEIKDRGHSHSMRIQDGTISEVAIDENSSGLFNERDSLKIRAARLFALPRPHIIWTPNSHDQSAKQCIDPVSVVLSGVTSRTDLFEPLSLVERIPVQSLCIDANKIEHLRRFPFSKKELCFLESLQVSTPISMILWKRGLDPRHAGALLVALNVLGLWREKWAPGLLPRIKSAVTIMLRKERCVDDFELLGIRPDHEPGDLERAFRRISLELHPDRMRGMPPNESKLAETAFQTVSGAYERLKHSRRSRPVRHVDKTEIAKVKLTKMRVDSWRELLRRAEQAASSGDNRGARMLALKALGLSPPSNARERLAEIIRRAA